MDEANSRHRKMEDQPDPAMPRPDPGRAPRQSMARPGRGHVSYQRFTRRRFWLAALLVFLGFAAVTLAYLVAQEKQAPPARADLRRAPAWTVLRPRAVVSTIDIAGAVNPYRLIPVSAPFDGAIAEKHVEVGDQVEAGALLVKMDGTELISKQREAEATYLAARMELQEIDLWDTSPDVQRARRQLTAARSGLERLEREVADLKGLFDRGIISRNEYLGAVIQLDQQKSAVRSAQEEVASTRARGNAENRKLAELKLQIAEARFRELQAQQEEISVLAPTRGIVMAPPKSGRENDSGTAVGSRLAEGAPMFIIADTSNFVLTGTVNELDIGKLHAGQAVLVEADALPKSEPLTGTVSAISAQAEPSKYQGGAPVFEIRVVLNPSNAETRLALRIGMSANMQIEAYRNDQALLIAPSAILTGSGQPSIVIDHEGKQAIIPVQLGLPFPEGIELVAGAEVGMKVLLDPQTASQPDAGHP